VIILGIDPGLATVGFGLIDAERGRLRHLRHGVVTTPAGVPLPRRLLSIAEDVEALLSAFHPEAVAVEELFFSKNVTTGLAVAHGRGVILAAVARTGLSVAEYKPMQVKQAVVGYGAAEKRQVMEMTRQLLGLSSVPRPDDAADALAVAICHAGTASSLLGRVPPG
jgi:crossover junction endodeoxyribonuclease RuvC